MAKRSKRQQKSNQSLREYRKLYSQAKRKGLVKGDKDARTVVPSKYMRKRLRELKPFLGPEYTVVKASPELSRVWRGAPSEIVPKAFNRKLVVKKAPGVRVSTKGGILSLRTKLKAGTFEELPLPVNVKSLNEFRAWIENNRYYNDILKHRDEYFNFKIYGNPSLNNFGDIEALIDELEMYRSFELDDWGDNQEFFSNFALFRSYRDWQWERDTPVYKTRKRAERKAKRRAWLKENRPEEYQKKLERERYNRSVARRSQPGYAAELKARREARKNETADEREARLEKQRAYKREWRDKNS